MKLAKELYEISRVFQDNNYQLFLVGGAIRNLLLGRSPGDFDLASDAPPQVIQRLFRRVIPTGIEFGTVTVCWKKLCVEITTFRLEGVYRNKRKPTSVQFSKDIKSDLLRRDFTINSIAYNIEEDSILDMFNGRQDIRDGIIRTIGNADTRFNEDALRMLRAIRFAATLNFSIEAKTLASIHRNRKNISYIAVERIQNELTKIFCSEHCNKGLALLTETRLLKEFLPLMEDDCPYIDSIPRESLEGRLALYYYMTKINAEEMEAGLTKLLFPKRIITSAVHLRRHLKKDVLSLKEGSLRHFLSRLSAPRRTYIEAYTPLITALAGESNAKEKTRALALIEAIEKEKTAALQIGELAVDGSMLMQKLGIPPGKDLGKILKQSLDYVLDEPSRNKEEILLKYIQDHLKEWGQETLTRKS